MVSLPWYLLAAGIAVLIVGFLMAGLPGAGGRGRVIHADMRDDDIIDELNEARRMPVSGYVILAGLLMIFVSVCWRLVRWFVAQAQ